MMTMMMVMVMIKANCSPESPFSQAYRHLACAGHQVYINVPRSEQWFSTEDNFASPFPKLHGTFHHIFDCHNVGKSTTNV